METFDFPFHLHKVRYPESGYRMQFGGGYQFSAAPDAPDQRIFTLTFLTLFYFTNEAGEVDCERNPQLNAGALEKFYQRHQLHKKFIYPHPVHGNIVVTFNKPLDLPDGVKGGNGALQQFTVEFIEHP